MSRPKWQLADPINSLLKKVEEIGPQLDRSIDEILDSLTDEIRIAHRGVQLVEQMWKIQRAETAAQNAGERLVELLEE